jgi:acyl transferase domain-containing protein
MLENDKDALTLNVSYRLNLRGPSIAVQTFCSTSLVATHLACRALRQGECDIALAGGVSVRVPVKAGYLYQEGDQVSHDGCCRSFDAAADGTVFGDGVALVVLKRLVEAVEDGDTIHAVVKGSSVNNDGGLKVGYAAPSVVGQAAAIEAALTDAGVTADSIDYVEAHGTATRLGDPIEVASLSKAFCASTTRRNFCALGSVKPNFGHLDRAAGVTGLIKTALALEHEELPATLHFERANPEIDFAASPFYVLTERRPWRVGGRPRRACVNSLGVGGTNAHVVVEEAPACGPSGPSRPWQLLLLSARSAAALEAATARLREHLIAQPDLPLADAAFTLQLGRRVMEHRRMLVCRDRADAIELLGGSAPRRVTTRVQKAVNRRLAFVFAGVGEHYPGWGRELYEGEPVFRTAVDRCCRLLQPHLGRDLREALFAAGPAAPPPARLGAMPRPPEVLRDTALAQPAAFVLDYAMAELWMAWGVRPGAVLGYSVGEYVAACLAGVLALEDALTLVARRAQAIAALAAGAMLAVSLDETAVQPWLDDDIALAAVNSPAACILAGPPVAIAALQRRLAAADIACQPVEAGHAFHTERLRPAADRLTALATSLVRQPPRIPCLSNVTGDWLTTEQATDAGYWAEHMCRPVRFADAAQRLLEQPEQIILEIGPGASLASFIRQHPHCSRERRAEVLSSLPPAHERSGELAALLATLGRLWMLDLAIDWNGFSAHEHRRRVALPTYPFERRRFWVDPQPRTHPTAAAPHRKPDLADWFSVPSWHRSATAPTEIVDRQCWLLLHDEKGLGTQLARWLESQGQQVVTVASAAGYARRGAAEYAVRPAQRADYDALLQELEREDRLPTRIVHLWMVGGDEDDPEILLERGFYSLLALTQALGDRALENCHIDVVSSGLQEVGGSEPLVPAKAAVIGPVKIIPQEYPNLSSRSIDLALPVDLAQLTTELLSRDEEDMVALRGSFRWVQRFEPLRLAAPAAPPLRERGVYLITGGLGGIGMALAQDLAALRSRLILVGRTARRTPAVEELEARGAEVLVFAADVADPPQIEAAVAAALTRFGTLHGILHTAGVPGVGLMQLKDPATAAAVLRPKVQGTLALARAVEQLPLDFLVLFSSVTSATGGGPGQVDYCAANAFLDAWACRQARDHKPILAISWGEWQWDAWQEGLQGFPEETRRYLIANRRHYGITFPEGAEALRRALASHLPHLFVTTQHLPDMVAGSRRSSAAAAVEKLDEIRRLRPRHPRPEIGTSYVAPTGELENKIATLWSHLLGIETVGADDNFFDLGGNSLLGIGLIVQLQKVVKTKLPLHMLYEAPTVRTMAEYLSGVHSEPVVLAEIESDMRKRRQKLQRFKQRAEAELA